MKKKRKQEIVAASLCDDNGVFDTVHLHVKESTQYHSDTMNDSIVSAASTFVSCLQITCHIPVVFICMDAALYNHSRTCWLVSSS